MVGQLASSKEYKPCLYRNSQENLGEERCFMITISIQNMYYIFSAIAVLCGASYKLGYEIGKNKRK
jgi:hypothetical protein